MPGTHDGVECLQVLSDLRRIYELIDASVYSLQLVRRHKTEAEMNQHAQLVLKLLYMYVSLLGDGQSISSYFRPVRHPVDLLSLQLRGCGCVYMDVLLHDKAAVLYPDAQSELSRPLQKLMHELEALLRSALELLNQLSDPFNFFTRAAERFDELREGVEKTLGLMEIFLQFAPPAELDAYGEAQVNIGLYDPLPEMWYEPPPAAEILLETKTSSSRGGAEGKPTSTKALTWRVLDVVHTTPGLFMDVFGYVDNRQQLSLLIESLKTLVPVEDAVHHVTSPYLQKLLSDPHRA